MDYLGYGRCNARSTWLDRAIGPICIVTAHNSLESVKCGFCGQAWPTLISWCQWCRRQCCHRVCRPPPQDRVCARRNHTRSCSRLRFTLRLSIQEDNISQIILYLSFQWQISQIIGGYLMEDDPPLNPIFENRDLMEGYIPSHPPLNPCFFWIGI